MTKRKKPPRPYGTGSIYQDKKRAKRWIGEILLDGKRHRVSGPTKTDVQAKLRALTVQAETGDLPKNKITVAQAVESFMSRKLPNMKRNGQPLAPSTVEVYKWATDIIVDQLGGKQLHTLTVEHVEAMLDRLANNGMSKASLHKIRSKLGQVIDFARIRKHVRENVARDAELPAGAKPTESRNALVPDDARKLLEVLRGERNGALYGLCLLVGLRPGEAAGLFWEDLDLDAEPPIVNITRGVRLAPGGATISDDLKTGRSKRTIEIGPDLVEWLRDHRRRQLEERLAASRWLDERLVFTTPTGHLTDPVRVRRNLKDICERAKVPLTRPNELRHSCASLLSNEGVSNEAIADLLGHTTTRMVDATYRHRLRPTVGIAAQAKWATGSD